MRSNTRNNLRNSNIPYMFHICKTSYAYVCQRRGSHTPRRYISSSYFNNVSSSGINQWYPGIFQRNRRFEDYTYKQFCKYGCACTCSTSTCIYIWSRHRSSSVFLPCRLGWHADCGSSASCKNI